ncbi:MAG: sugar phosphate isomerase/epimerase family protein [Dehalococcoidia bacterium]
MPTVELGFHCNHLEYLDQVMDDNGLSRTELFNLPAKDIPELKRKLFARGLARSVHSPLVKPDWYPNPPTWSFLCDVDKDSRNKTFSMLGETIAQAQDVGGEYIVAHFPTPATDASGEDENKLLSITWKSCEQLANLSVQRSMPIHVEGLANSPHLSDGFLTEALSEYPLHYCFDMGHMHLASQASGFDVHEFAQDIAPFVGSVHLWNVRDRDDYVKFRHIPVHPSQDPEEGWADIKGILETLKPACPVIFESPVSYPESLGNHDYREGVEWVQEIVADL